MNFLQHRHTRNPLSPIHVPRLSSTRYISSFSIQPLTVHHLNVPTLLRSLNTKRKKEFETSLITRQGRTRRTRQLINVIYIPISHQFSSTEHTNLPFARMCIFIIAKPLPPYYKNPSRRTKNYRIFFVFAKLERGIVTMKPLYYVAASLALTVR